jgi:MscS family membrane protein
LTTLGPWGSLCLVKTPEASPSNHRWLLGLLTCLVAWLVTAAAAAQTSPLASARPAALTIEEPVDEGSPRAAVAEFLRLCRADRFEDAARYLDVPKARLAEGAELARRLKAVMDRHAWVDLETISAIATGDTKDGIPLAFEGIASIPKAGGGTEPLRLFRRAAVGGTPAWVVSRTTVEHIDGWYSALEHRWMLERLPPALLKAGPRELLYWQWMALPAVALLALALGALLSRLSRRILVWLVSRSHVSWDDHVATRVRGPLTLLFALGLVYLTLPWFGLYQPADAFVQGLLRGGLLFAFFWALGRMVEVWGRIIVDSRWGKDNITARSLAPFGIRLAKLVVFTIAVFAFVSAMGYSPTSLIAGLGVGGLAVALAGQKTVENLFGAVSISVDQPFRPGDFIKVEDFIGTVESIGLRSTRIRTLDRTIITIPNGRLSEMRVETFALRDRIRLAMTVGLIYGTTAEQMRTVLAGMEKVLRDHPKIWPDTVDVRFKELGASSLNIDVMAWFLTSEWSEFQTIRQEVLLDFMRVVEEAGTEFAFPTTTVHLEQRTS